MSSMSDLSFLLDKVMASQQQSGQGQGRIPATDAVAELPQRERKEASRIAKFYFEQYQHAMALRKPHALSWIKVLSILSGIHYFKISDAGAWIPLKKRDPRQIRAFVPVLEPMSRWEHGRLSANQIGVTATPTTGRGIESFWNADLAQDSLNHWLEEIGIQTLDDIGNQYLLTYGGYCDFIERSAADEQAYLRKFPFCDLFPIPYDARTWEEMEGIGRCILVSEAWGETQDELYRKRHGRDPDQPMAKRARGMSTMPHLNYAGFSGGVTWGSSYRGMVAIWIWRKPSVLTNGLAEHLFLLDDELYGFAGYQAGRKLPLYPVYYIKHPHDWYPKGFSEQLVPMQREINRQVTSLLESSVINRGFVGYNSELITANAIQDSVTGLVPFQSPGPEDRHPPLMRVDAGNISREAGAVLEIMQAFSRSAVGYDSDIIFGGQEGRTEGGPATQLLNTNAQAPLLPVLERKGIAYKAAFADALDAIREVWPEEKKIRVNGPQGLVVERMVRRDKLPGSMDVVLSPLPLLPNGRMGALNLLLTLRNQPVEAGEPRLVQTHEVRTAVQMLGLALPGLSLVDPRERRIRWRIGQLINDGKEPAIAPAGVDPTDFQAAESHDLAVKLLTEVLLHPSTRLYSPQVRSALQKELEFHNGRAPGVAGSGRMPVDVFDDATEALDARQAENMLETIENDPTTLAGQFAPMGVPVGL